MVLPSWGEKGYLPKTDRSWRRIGHLKCSIVNSNWDFFFCFWRESLCLKPTDLLLIDWTLPKDCRKILQLKTFKTLIKKKYVRQLIKSRILFVHSTGWMKPQGSWKNCFCLKRCSIIWVIILLAHFLAKINRGCARLEFLPLDGPYLNGPCVHFSLNKPWFRSGKI